MKAFLFALLVITAGAASAQSSQQLTVGSELLLTCPQGSETIINVLNNRKTSIRCASLGCVIDTYYKKGTDGSTIYFLNLKLTDGREIRFPKKDYIREQYLQKNHDLAEQELLQVYDCDRATINPNYIRKTY